MLPKIIKFGFFLVFIFLAFLITSENNKTFAAEWKQQSCDYPGSFSGYCSSTGYWTSTYCDVSGQWVYYYDPSPNNYCGCNPAQCDWSLWKYTCIDTQGCHQAQYCYPAGGAYAGCLYSDPTCYTDPTCPTPPPPIACPNSGIPNTGWGGSCSPGTTDQKQACDGPHHCSVASCTFYASNSAGNTYCWYNSGTCYNDPASCDSVNPCPQITCGGNPGAGGTCSYPNSPNVNIGSCTYTCSYPFGPSSNVPGHTISVCQSNNCYANSCQCYPDNPCPPCPTITCGTNSGAGGVCSYGSSPNQNIPGVTATCQDGRQVPGYSISVCQSNNCYYNDCTPYPNPGTCNNGYTKTVQTCNAQGNGYDTATSCVSTCSTATPTPIPTPAPPPCNTGPSCGSCSAACSNNNSNTKTCTFTRHTSGVQCIPTQSAPCGGAGNACPDGTGCAQNCPTNLNCVSGSCRFALSIAGNVFVDTNVNGTKDAGEGNYNGTITITNSPTGGTTTYPVTGSYLINELPAGSYMISYQDPPTGAGGYSITYPPNGPPPSMNVSIGNGNCSTGDAGNHGALCDANGSISNLNFGITNNKPWIQCEGADCRIDTGFIDKIPSTAAGGAFANKNGSGGFPGLIFTGNATPDFSPGQASSTNWVVGGPTNGETYSPTKIGGAVKTSYNYVLSKATQGNITPTDIAPFCSGGITNCTLQPLSHGVYRANGSLNLVGTGYTFGPNQNFVILVSGDLTISERIVVPNGSTALFSSSGNINIDKTLGEASSSTSSTIQGIFSADKNFVAQSYGGCGVRPDLRLNIEGSVIVNGALIAGTFDNRRDLCADDISYPTVHFLERVDFILNTPDFLKNANFTYQEIAP